MLHFLTIFFAVSLVLFTAQDAFEVMLLPRRVARRIRLTRYYFRSVWWGWSATAMRLPAGAWREGFLGVFGTLSVVILFALWSAALILGFGLLEWALEPAASSRQSHLGEQLYMSGVTFFTLGYGDVVPHSQASRLLAVLEAGTGLGFIAVVIGYLPVLYQLFSRREAHVIMLDGRAGSPPTATTMLVRHAEADGLLNLEQLLRGWETWSSELLESHLSYPILIFYRSQHDNQSWLAALAAVMDCCALVLVGVEDLHPLQARMTFTLARQVIVEVSRMLAIEPFKRDRADRLPPATYARVVAVFKQAGLRWTEAAGAEASLAALRATYEPLLEGLSRRLLLPLPGWLATEDAADHWQRGHRGLIASQLVEQLSAGQPVALTRGESRLRRLLSRTANRS